MGASTRIAAIPRFGRAALGLTVDRWALVVVPGLVFLAVVFLYPLAEILLRSVNDPPNAGAKNYLDFFQTESDVRILRNTFWIAGLSTLTTLLIGYPYAYLMTIVRPRIAGLLLIAVLLPFWSSLLVRTFAWQVILRDTGIINTMLRGMGIGEVGLIRTTPGVIIGMSHVLLPFMVLPLYAVMRRIDPEYLRAAANLGASPRRAFLRVFVPLSAPGVVAGVLLVFILALGFYITPALLGGPRDTMISQLIVQRIQQQLDWGDGSAMAALLTALTLVLLFVASRLVRLRDAFGSALED